VFIESSFCTLEEAKSKPVQGLVLPQTQLLKVATFVKLYGSSQTASLKKQCANAEIDLREPTSDQWFKSHRKQPEGPWYPWLQKAAPALRKK
jgi:hypothetical protein